MTNAILTNAILTNADLSTSDLTDTTFSGANLEDANVYHHRTTYKMLNWLISPASPITTIKMINSFDKVDVFDFVHGSIPFSEVDDDNVIFYIENQIQGFSFPRDALQNAYNDRSSIFVSCVQLFPRSAVDIDKVIPFNLYFRLNLTVALFVPIDSIKALLTSNHKEWFIKNTGNIINYSASIKVVCDNSDLNIFGEEISLVSRDHCQAGSEQKAYSLTPVEFVKSSDTHSSNGGRKKKRKYTAKKNKNKNKNKNKTLSLRA